MILLSKEKYDRLLEEHRKIEETLSYLKQMMSQSKQEEEEQQLINQLRRWTGWAEIIREMIVKTPIIYL